MANNNIALPVYMKSIPDDDCVYMSYWESPSHEGWLVVLCQDDEDITELNLNSRTWKEGDCFLWNPATFQTIVLPSLSYWVKELQYTVFGDSCVLSSPPTKPNSMVFFFMWGSQTETPSYIVFCSPGEKQWRSQEVSPNAYYLLWLKVSNKLYIANTYQDEIHEIERLEPKLSIKSFTITNNNRHPIQGELAYPEMHYVECGNELFKVVREYHYMARYDRMLYIKVSKLSLASTASWEEVKSMDDNVLFIGYGTTASSSATKLGLEKGCVYYTQHNDEGLYKFDLEDNSISVSLALTSSPLMQSSSVWLDMVRVANGRREHIRSRNIEEKFMLKVMEEKTSSIVQPTLVSPCFVFLRKEDPAWNFVDVMHNNDKYHMKLSEFLSDAEIRFSKSGWLLMSKGKNTVFFFNPFTEAVIQLPDLHDIFKISTFSFSSLPTSSDCVLIAIEEQYRHLCIYYISQGDKKWSFDSFNNTIIEEESDKSRMEFIPWLNNPVFFNGVFYCLDRHGTLGVFDKNKECKWEVLVKPEKPTDSSVRTSFLVECEGDLISVFLGHQGKNLQIFRLDSSKNWVRVEILQKHMLFISETSSMSAIAPNSLMENKIYFDRFHGREILYYCLDTRRYYSPEGQHSAGDFYGTKKHLNCTWIEPNWSHNTDKELDWRRS